MKTPEIGQPRLASRACRGKPQCRALVGSSTIASPAARRAAEHFHRGAALDHGDSAECAGSQGAPFALSTARRQAVFG